MRCRMSSPTSTSGGVGPRFYLNKNGINPEEFFKSLIYAGKHDSVFLAVKNKKVDAGAVGGKLLGAGGGGPRLQLGIDELRPG